VNLRDARIVLRPRGLSDILDLAMRACVTLHRPVFLRLTALTLVPLALALVGAHRLWHIDWAWLWWVALVLAAPLSGLFTIAAGQLLFAEEVSVADVFRRWWRRLGALSGMLLLWRAVAAATMILYVFALLRPYVYEAVLLEGAGVGRAWTRAGQLARRVPGTSLALSLLLAAAPLVLGLYAMVLVEGVGRYVLMLPLPDDWTWNHSPYLPMGVVFAVPYVACARLIGYIDARTRSEGWDVQVRFAAVVQQASAPRQERAA
jgi:hypothetical protein